MILRFLVILLLLVISCSDESTSPSPTVSGFELPSIVNSAGSYALSEAEALLGEEIESLDGSDLCKELAQIRKDFRAEIARYGIRPSPVTIRHGSAENAARDRAKRLAFEYD